MPRKRSEVRATVPVTDPEAAAAADAVDDFVSGPDPARKIGGADGDPWDLAGTGKTAPVPASPAASAPRRTRRGAVVGTTTPAEASPAEEQAPEQPAPPATPRAAASGQPDVLFQSAQRTQLPPVPDLRRGFGAIVKRVFDEGLDVAAEYGEIEESFTIKGALTPGALEDAASRTEEVARRAFRLYVVAQHEYEAFVRETDAIVGAMRERSNETLEHERAEKVRTKNITDADVTARIAQLFPDQWAEVCDRRSRAGKMVDYLHQLASLAKSRAYTVSNILGSKSRL